jgi:hypothetical protein
MKLAYKHSINCDEPAAGQSNQPVAERGSSERAMETNFWVPHLVSLATESQGIGAEPRRNEMSLRMLSVARGSHEVS